MCWVIHSVPSAVPATKVTFEYIEVFPDRRRLRSVFTTRNPFEHKQIHEKTRLWQSKFQIFDSDRHKANHPVNESCRWF